MLSCWMGPIPRNVPFTRAETVAVCSKSGYGQVRMEGDRTRFVQSTGFDEQRKLTVLNTVAKERLAGLHREQQTRQKPAN